MTGRKSDLSKIVVEDVLSSGFYLRIKVHGPSMHPFIRNGDTLIIRPSVAADLNIGDIVLYLDPSGIHVVHRLIKRNGPASLITKGDYLDYYDPPVSTEQVLGKVVAVERNGRCRKLDGTLSQALSMIFAKLSPMSRWLRPSLRPIWRSCQIVFKNRLKG